MPKNVLAPQTTLGLSIRRARVERVSERLVTGGAVLPMKGATAGFAPLHLAFCSNDSFAVETGLADDLRRPPVGIVLEAIPPLLAHWRESYQREDDDDSDEPG